MNPKVVKPVDSHMNPLVALTWSGELTHPPSVRAYLMSCMTSPNNCCGEIPGRANGKKKWKNPSLFFESINHCLWQHQWPRHWSSMWNITSNRANQIIVLGEVSIKPRLNCPRLDWHLYVCYGVKCQHFDRTIEPRLNCPIKLWLRNNCALFLIEGAFFFLQ